MYKYYITIKTPANVFIFVVNLEKMYQPLSTKSKSTDYSDKSILE